MQPVCLNIDCSSRRQWTSQRETTPVDSLALDWNKNGGFRLNTCSLFFPLPSSPESKERGGSRVTGRIGIQTRILSIPSPVPAINLLPSFIVRLWRHDDYKIMLNNFILFSCIRGQDSPAVRPHRNSIAWLDR